MSTTDSISRDIEASLDKLPPFRPPTPGPNGPPSSTTSASNTDSGSFMFLYILLIVFVLAAGLFFLFYSRDGTSGWMQNVQDYLPSFMRASPTLPTSFVTTNPVNALSPTTVPSSPLSEQSDPVTETTRLPGQTQPGKKRFDYHADDSYSHIQQNKASGKSGWCYIGEDRGFRSCAKVSESDVCASGDIFPSQDMCINPNLRYT